MNDIPTYPTGFSYEALNADIRDEVRWCAGEIKGLLRRFGEDMIEIGDRLIKAKKWLGHGHWGPWLKAEFGWSQDTATRLIQVVEAFGYIPQIAEFQPSALYALAAPSTPAPARAEAIERARAGEQITHKVARYIIAEYKVDPDPVERSWVKVVTSPRISEEPAQHHPLDTKQVNGGKLWAERAQEVVRAVDSLGDFRKIKRTVSQWSPEMQEANLDHLQRSIQVLEIWRKAILDAGAGDRQPTLVCIPVHTLSTDGVEPGF